MSSKPFGDPGTLRKLFERALIAIRVDGPAYLEHAKSEHIARGNPSIAEGGKKVSAFSNFQSQISRTEYTFAFFMKALSILNLRNVKLTLSFEFDGNPYSVSVDLDPPHQEKENGYERPPV